MRMRFSLFKFSLGRLKRKTMADVEKDMDFSFTKGEIMASVCFVLLLAAYFVPNEVVSGVLALIAVVMYVVATIIDCFRYSPVTRWRHASVKTALYGTVWTVLPIVLYLTEVENREDMIPIAISSVAMWIGFAVSLYLFLAARREARARAAIMDMKIRTRRKTAIGR